MQIIPGPVCPQKIIGLWELMFQNQEASLYDKCPYVVAVKQPW